METKGVSAPRMRSAPGVVRGCGRGGFLVSNRSWQAWFPRAGPGLSQVACVVVLCKPPGTRYAYDTLNHLILFEGVPRPQVHAADGAIKQGGRRKQMCSDVAGSSGALG